MINTQSPSTPTSVAPPSNIASVMASPGVKAACAVLVA